MKAKFVVCLIPQYENLTVAEGEDGSLAMSILAKKRVENSSYVSRNSLLHVHYDRLPEHGTLFINQTSVLPSTSYSMDELLHSTLTYSHDGSETIQDYFTVAITLAELNSTDQKVK